MQRVGWSRRAYNTARVAAMARVERRVPFWPLARIEWLQRRRLRAIVRHAYETVPFYRRAMDERGLCPRDFGTVDDLAKLPLLDGEMVRRDPEQFVSNRYGEGARHAFTGLSTRPALVPEAIGGARSPHLFATSGTQSHARKQIYWDNASVLRTLVHNERDRAVVAKLIGEGWGTRQLFVFTPVGPWQMLRTIWDGQTLNSRRWAERHQVSPGLPFAEVAERIDAIRPHMVYSTGSYADQFFRFLADRGLPLTPPRIWIYGGDTLSPDGLELIEGTFGCPVYSTYQAVETGRLGFQCEHRQGFHLNVDLCAVRIVDPAGRTVAPGETGELVVSNLHNRATVLLNYRLGDRGALAVAPCPCGRSLPLLERLEGRTSEVISLADGRTISYMSLSARFRQELSAALRVQVVQPADGHIRWRIVPFASADCEALRRALVEKGRDALGEGTLVEVEFVDDIPSTPQDKLRRVVRSADDDG